MIRAALLSLGLLAGLPAFAQSADPALLAEEAAAQLGVAQAALEAAEGAQDRVAALTDVITAYESGLEAMREGMRRAALREAEIARMFDADQARLAQLLGALMSMQAEPGPASLLHPDGALGTARSGMILADVTPAFSAEVGVLRAALEEVAVLRTLQQGAADTLAAGLQGVQQARTELSQAMSDRTDLPKRLTQDPEAMQRLIDSAETLSGFAAGLTELDLNSDLPDLPDLASAKGSLPLPVNGTLLYGAGQADAAGIARPGIILATRPLAMVTAPWPGTIRYAGPLLDYGNVMILEPGNDVLMVFAGLSRVYGEVGQVIPAGTPLGLMGGDMPAPGSYLSPVAEGGGGTRTETLYIEVRKNGTPTDPALWFDLNAR